MQIPLQIISLARPSNKGTRSGRITKKEPFLSFQMLFELRQIFFFSDIRRNANTVSPNITRQTFSFFFCLLQLYH